MGLSDSSFIMDLESYEVLCNVTSVLLFTVRPMDQNPNAMRIAFHSDLLRRTFYFHHFLSLIT